MYQINFTKLVAYSESDLNLKLYFFYILSVILYYASSIWEYENNLSTV